MADASCSRAPARFRPVPARLAGVLLALAGTLGLATSARADGRLEAKYVLTVGGVELGRASVVAVASDATYEISGSGRITGVLRAVTAGKGRAAARGTLDGARMLPQLYALNAEAGDTPETARLVMADGALRDMDVEPPLKPHPDRVPLTDAVLRNILDPMSGAFVYVPGTADLLSKAACDRSVPVFDGRQRYDVALKFQRIEEVKTEGYAGPAVVCTVRYTPVAGHRPSRSTVKYMAENKNMSVWLVPLPGTRLLAPFKVSVATMIGTAVFSATSFSARQTAAATR